MNKEEAIKGLKEDIYNLKNFLTDTEKEKWQETIDTVLDYIEELEKKSKKCEYFEEVADVLYKDSINKQKIRDKIEELKKQTSTINDKQISKKYSHTQFARECCIGLLKELLGE